jgi:hypothetical protein
MNITTTPGDTIIKVSDASAARLGFGSYRGYALLDGTGALVGRMTDTDVRALAAAHALRRVDRGDHADCLRVIR